MSKKNCRFTEHHLVPRSRGGSNHPENIVLLPWKMHKAYHKIFGNKTIDEAVTYLDQFKEQELNVYIMYIIILKLMFSNQFFLFFVFLNISHEYGVLFGNRTIEEAKKFLLEWKEGYRKKIRNNARIKNIKRADPAKKLSQRKKRITKRLNSAT